MPEVDEPMEMLTRAPVKEVRSRLVQDDSSHWYLIPADKQLAWWEWSESQEARDGVEPAWAKRIDSYTRLTFTDPQED